MIHDNSEDEGRRYCQIRLGNAPLPCFQYEPLEPRCIRILELQPGQRSDAFQGRFIKANVDRDFGYDALSYMWGNAAQVDRVAINGAALPVAWNLTRALEYLRDFSGLKPLRIWIDAICIDQDSLKERAEQIAMMRSIYRNADCVRLWINEPAIDEECAAVAALKSFKYDSWQTACGLGSDGSFWDPLRPIFRNGHWRRIWIQQEVLNAQKFMLHCMNVTFDDMPVAQFRYHEMFAIYGEKRTREELIVLLDRSCQLQASRSHDRLYALMHLAGGYEEGSIVVDYTKTEAHVMVDAAAYHISQHQNLEFLLDSFHDDAEASASLEVDDTVSLTWIPGTWMGRKPQGLGLPSPGSDSSMSLNAARRRHTECSPHSVNVRNRRLRIRGLKVGWVRQRFVFNPKVTKLTVAQFWASSLGKHFQSYLEDATIDLPPEVTRTVYGSLGSYKYNHKDINTGLRCFFDIGQSPENADRTLGYRAWDIHDLLDPLHKANLTAYHALTRVLENLERSSCIMTNSTHFGITPRCNIREGDEIWLVLGCSRPIIVRPQPGGRYWHICPAKIPLLEDHKDIAYFTSDIQPGDKVGEWTVEDIELD